MQIDEILSRFHNVKRTGDRQYIACCPAHDDAKQSLSIGAGDGKILLNCFAGCDTRDIVAAVGLNMKDLYTDHSGSTYTPPATLPKKMPVSQRQGTKPAAYTHSKEYIYTDEDGAFIARKIKRYDDSGNKTFAWKTFDADGNEINGNGMKGSPMYLYNIAELCRNRDALAADGAPMYIVEGEKDADTVKDMSLVAVSLPNGASSAWNKDAYNKYFTGLNVVILTDNDDAGRKSGHKIANALLNTASSIKLIHSESIYTELKEKGDITDIVVEIGAEKAKTALLAAVDTAPVYKLKKPEAPQHDDLPMFILEKTDRLGNGYHYDIPECCDIACEAYKVENDPVRRFLSECTQSRTQKQIFKSELTKARVYQCYKNWCLVCKEYTVSKSVFNMTLCQKYKVRDIAEITLKTNGGNEYYKPFTLTQAAINEYGC